MKCVMTHLVVISFCVMLMFFSAVDRMLILFIIYLTFVGKLHFVL